MKNQDFYQNFRGFLAISRVRNVRFSKFKRFWNQQTKPVKMTYNLTYVLKKSPWDNKPVDQVVVAIAWQQDWMRFYWFFSGLWRWQTKPHTLKISDKTTGKQKIYTHLNFDANLLRHPLYIYINFFIVKWLSLFFSIFKNKVTIELRTQKVREFVNLAIYIYISNIYLKYHLLKK